MIAQTYCGVPYHDTRGEVRDCDAADGPCPSCLRSHIAKLEARNAELEAGRPDLADLLRKRYPRLLEPGNPLYDGVLARAVQAQAGGVVVPGEAEDARAAKEGE